MSTKIYFEGKAVGELNSEGRIAVGSKVNLGGHLMVITAAIGTEDRTEAIVVIPAEAA